PFASPRPARSSDTSPESFQVSGEKWRGMASYLAWRRHISPGEESPLSPDYSNFRPATRAQIWGSASNLALASLKTHPTQLIDP
ncbi:hypothetical protein A2U01_0042251, partial [Trifolium medium]|nr:hypothetical protein [Trifolium medium]